MIEAIRRLLAALLTLLASAVLSIFIWGIAVQENDVTQRRLLEIPVDVIGLSADSQIGLNPEVVEVRVAGPTSIVDSLTEDDFTVEIDVTSSPAGTSEVEAVVEFSNPRVTKEFQFPDTIEITIDRIVSKDIEVEIDVRGNVAQGYEQGETFVDPPLITISGPASRVDRIVRATVDIFLDGPRENVTQTRLPTFLNQQGDITSVAGLTLNSREVQVTVEVNQLAGFAAKPIIVNWEGQPAQGYRLIDVSVEPDNVLVTGRTTQLDLLIGLRTEPIDITGLRESVTLQANLELPEGVELVEVQPIVARIDIEPILTTGVVRSRPEIRGLAEGLTATLDVETVSVFLGGPFDKLQSITDMDVSVTLDLFDLMVGTHVLDVPMPAVVVSDVDVRSWQPTQITVLITDIVTATTGLTDTLTLTDTEAFLSPPTPVVGAASASGPAAGLPPTAYVLPFGPVMKPNGMLLIV